MRIQPRPAHLRALRVIENHRNDRRPAREKRRQHQHRTREAGERAERMQRVNHVGERDQAFAGVADRRYALRDVKHRLHQASFREAVIAAYNGRCALSGLPEPLLLDAAHIIADKDEQYGQPVVPNGIPLSKIHHAAFDSHLIGIDPDFRIHVSHRLLTRQDGPLLETLKRLDKGTLHLPARSRDRPDRDRLAIRYEKFNGAA
ncbi:MAG: hypothetical protein E6H42_01680 [Betaproteobacteria bacterium]|nr:MAG: hypothetical protein E6H42_01680 [Betaproteobacteria bacterium]